MNLVERLPWHDSISDNPPQKFDYRRITPPDDFEFTFVGTIHHSGFGLPSFIGDMLKDRSVIFLEGGKWEREQARRYQEIANGSSRALKTTVDVHEKMARLSPMQRPILEWNIEFYKQLYETNVRVVCADYPKSHPDSTNIARVFQRGGADKPRNFPLRLLRDQLITENICRGIADLRKFLKGFGDISPLRGIAVMGMSHDIVADALNEAARQKSVSSFASEVLYTEHPAGVPLDEPQLEIPGIINYQNWVRSPEQ